MEECIDALQAELELTRSRGYSTDNEEFMTGMAAVAVPAKRFGSPEEFGELAAFLCSAQAGYITGQNFRVDGGITRSV